MKYYVKKKLQPMRPYIRGESLKGIGVPKGQSTKRDDLMGGKIAHDPNNPDDKWYVSKELFESTYTEFEPK